MTPDRLVTLKRRSLPDTGEGFRGPAPTSFQTFFRSGLRATQATLFASIHQALSQRSRPNGGSIELQPCLENGERLCDAYEIFRAWEPDADLEFDQAVLLARGAAKSEDIELTRVRTVTVLCSSTSGHDVGRAAWNVGGTDGGLLVPSKSMSKQ